MPKKRSHYKHTLPCLARSTYNQLQQEQHDKASLVCVRVQSPSGLALVPCALSMVDLSGQLRCSIKHPWYKKLVLIVYFWHPMLVRPAMWRFFCLKAKNCLIIMPRFMSLVIWPSTVKSAILYTSLSYWCRCGLHVPVARHVLA